MRNIIVIIHNGTQLSEVEERNLALSLSKLTSSDEATVSITQMSEEEAISAVAGVVLSKVRKQAKVDLRHKNTEGIVAAINTIRGIIALGGRFSYPTDFGRSVSIKFATIMNSSSATDAAFKKAITILATRGDEIDFDDPLCTECNFTKLHLLEIQKVHKYFSTYMI